MLDRESDHEATLERSIQTWVQDEHPDEVELAQRAGRLAVELSQRGVTLADICRTVFAYVADRAEGSGPEDGNAPHLERRGP